MIKLFCRTNITKMVAALCFFGTVMESSLSWAQNSVSALHGELLSQQSGGALKGTNSAGWNSGYSIVTSTRERTNPFGVLNGRSDTYVESTSKLVPNGPLGEPIRGAIRAQQNSHGWYTGYSAVTSTYTRPSTILDPIGSGETVTESVTQVVPNDPLGQPILPFGWP